MTKEEFDRLREVGSSYDQRLGNDGRVVYYARYNHKSGHSTHGESVVSLADAATKARNEMIEFLEARKRTTPVSPLAATLAANLRH